MRPAGERDALIAAAIAGDGWIFDGNHFGSLDVRAERADTLVFLDLPRGLCMRRLLTRIALGHGRVRPDMAEAAPALRRRVPEMGLAVSAAFAADPAALPRRLPRPPLPARHPREVAAFLDGVRLDREEGA